MKPKSVPKMCNGCGVLFIGNTSLCRTCLKTHVYAQLVDTEERFCYVALTRSLTEGDEWTHAEHYPCMGKLALKGHVQYSHNSRLVRFTSEGKRYWYEQLVKHYQIYDLCKDTDFLLARLKALLVGGDT